MKTNQIRWFALMSAAMAPAAMADTTFYGKANVAIQSADEAGDSEVQLVSNASRVGLLGDLALTEGLTAIYRFEYETSIDDGEKDGQTFSQRNIYLGLQSGAGTLMAGKFDTPTKAAQGDIDLFSDLEGDLKNVFAGEIRANDIIQYVTPKSLGPVTAKLAYVTEESDGTDGISASVAYENDALYLAASIDQDMQGDTIESDLYRVIGAYKFGPVQLGAAYETLDTPEGDGDGYFASAKWSIDDNWVAKAQYGESDLKIDGRETLSLGVDYKFTGKTKVFAYYTDNQDDLIRDDQYLGLGAEVKF